MGPLTANIAAQLAHHEGLVVQAYLDVGDVWTWGIGVTAASGHDVSRYINAPAPYATCLQVFAQLLAKTYLPTVHIAFEGYALSEAQLGAALSFHYNTGAIQTAAWVPLVKCGKTDAAKAAIMEWCRPAQVTARRAQERDLFFDGTWTHGYEVPVLDVDTHHRPDPQTLRRINMRTEFEALFATP